MYQSCLGFVRRKESVIAGYIFFGLISTFISGLPQGSRDSRASSTSCDFDCSMVDRQLVCGTDGRTYNSECEISKAANCEGLTVRIKYAGECSDATRCLIDRAEAQETARKPAAGVFIPDCHPDGTYVDVQCHSGTGYCWCVTTQGKPIPGSSARYKRPNCIAYQNANSHKRTSRGKKPRKSCSITDREDFNKNMNRIFESEYNRTVGARNASLTVPLSQRVANWKFTLLDVNRNNLLSKSELRDLRRMVKKIIRPRPCARTFTQYCDLDQNKNITREEWVVCLGMDNDGPSWLIRGHHPPPERVTTPMPPGLRGRQIQSLRQLLAATFTAPPLHGSVDYPRPRWQNNPRLLNSGSLNSGLVPDSRPTDSSARRRDPSKKRKPNCLAERAKALAKQGRALGSGIYVPNCEKTGSYASVQCHAATGYCWCVNPENGKPIPNTSTHNSQPNCNVSATRQLRGCQIQQKEPFLTDLAATLVNEMTSSLANSSTTMPGFKPSQDDAFRWKFRMMDKNDNAYIERPEWRDFKQSMAKEPKLAKCGRGFYKFCDSDDNKRVTVEEWLKCVSIAHEPRKLPVNMKRKGSNPLTKYLKPD